MRKWLGFNFETFLIVLLTALFVAGAGYKMLAPNPAEAQTSLQMRMLQQVMRIADTLEDIERNCR